MEHHDEHAAEYERWVETAASSGEGKAAESIRSAAAQMAQAGPALQQALEELGGPLSPEVHSHAH